MENIHLDIKEQPILWITQITGNNLFYWQIKIVRSKAAPEPNNYRPEQL